MMKTLFTILLLLPLWLSGQCFTGSLDSTTALSDTSKIGNSLLCYQPCDSCIASLDIHVPFLDGCVEIYAQYGWSVVVIRDSCNKVLLDTCVDVPPTGIPAVICYSYTTPTILTVCRDTTSWYLIRYNPSVGSPLLAPLTNLDSLCQSPVYIIEPIKVDTILIGSYDLQGRPWKSGPRIDVFQSGSTFYTRKWWDVYKK